MAKEEYEFYNGISIFGGATNREGGSSKPVDLSVTSLLTVVVARVTWPERSKSPENLVYVQGTCESAQSI